MMVAAGKLKDAEAEIDRLLVSQPDSPDLLTTQAFIFMLTNRLDQAQVNIDRVLRVDQGNPVALVYRAQLQASRPGGLDDAIRDLEVVRNANPNSIDARRMLADLYRRKGDLPGEIGELEGLLLVMPNDKSIMIRLAERYAQASPPRWNDAERLFRNAKADPGMAADADIFHNEALMWLARKDLAKAGENVRRAVELKPESSKHQATLLRVMLEQRQASQVVARADQFLAKNPESRDVWRMRAMANVQLNKADIALADLTRAFEISLKSDSEQQVGEVVNEVIGLIGPKRAIEYFRPKADGNDAVRILLAQLLSREGQEDETIEIAEGLVKRLDQLTPNVRVATLRFLGTFYLTSKNKLNPSRARELYGQLLQLTPDDYTALNNMAYALLLPDSGGTPSEAIKHSQAAVNEMRKLGINDPLILDTHGWALIQNGRIDEGINTIREALNRQEFPDGWYHIAEGYLKEQKFADAEQALRKAMDIIDQMQRDKLEVDPNLVRRIDAALTRVKDAPVR
jgi:tetratricopeptide (TPR) repeat protein